MPDLDQAAAILASVRSAGAGFTEVEGLALLRSLGIAVPRHVVLTLPKELSDRDLARFAGDRLVLKAVAPGLAHKSDVGAVEIVDRRASRATEAIAAMQARLQPIVPAGFLIEEFVEHDASLGGELLVALRWTDDFGPVVSVGVGGIHAELLARDLRPEARVAMVLPGLTPARGLGAGPAGLPRRCGWPRNRSAAGRR